MIKHVTDEDLWDFKDAPYKSELPNHTQGVERMIALMTKCNMKCVGEDRQSGHQIAVKKHLEAVPGRKRRRRCS